MKQTKTAIFVVIILITILSSCKTSGYGCKGNESWGKMVRRINY